MPTHNFNHEATDSFMDLAPGASDMLSETYELCRALLMVFDSNNSCHTEIEVASFSSNHALSIPSGKFSRTRWVSPSSLSFEEPSS